MTQRLTSERIQTVDSIEDINALYLERGWSDGLPIIPPTEEAVERMLTGTHRNCADVIGVIPPLWSEATVEKIAINAVMAGCLPEYIPVLIAAVSAISEEPFNLRGIQATTHPVSILLIVNGPIAKKLNINGKSGAFGPGWRSNACIGRAMRLILMNIGGAYPGKSDMSTQGQSAKYTFCIAENEDDNPWEPLHVERGFDKAMNTVTVAGVENPHNINDHCGIRGEEVLNTITGTVATIGHNNVLKQYGEPIIALGPEHAETIFKSGFSKNSIREFIYEKSRIPIGRFNKGAVKRYFSNKAPDSLLALTGRPEDIIIIVVGGPGKHTSFLPSFGITRSITKEI